MPTTYRQIAQIDVTSATTYTDLYTVPTSTSVVVSTISICNRTTSNATFRICIRSGTAASGAGTSSLGTTSSPSTSSFLFYDTIVYANSTLAITAGVTMTAAEVMTVYASAGNALTFQLFGSIIT